MIHITGENYNSREIIKNIFSPLVGVLTSPLADDVCQRNNLSFMELIQPFSKLLNDAQFRDVSGTSVTIRGLRINFCDVDWRPPQTVLARKMLNESVMEGKTQKTKLVAIGAINLELPSIETWFEHWRETFLTVQFPSDHEFMRHFLSCLIVLSSTDPNIVETAQKLTQRIQQMQALTPQKLPKWFYPTDVLNSYVVLYERLQGDLTKAQHGFELLKAIYGENNCFIIQLNSISGSTNGHDYWTSYIKTPLKDSSIDQFNTPKTPQEAVPLFSMPSMHLPVFVAGSTNNVALQVLHPLSPVQEHAAEAINSDFCISNECLMSQGTYTNVWNDEQDINVPRGSCLTSQDIENLRHFVQDYTLRALIPYAERLVVILNEAITHKKGVSKSLLSATKRWFITSKPGASTSNQNAVVYTQDSAELQTRKLGDLYFMFGHYNLAFQAYHQAKRDFNADSAWQCYAGALEMAAVSAFMLGTSNRKTYDYMEDAIVCYLTVCKLQQFATRATLLSMECLKTARLFGETAKQLIRMTTEESDLRSALLLEQAAYCFLAMQPPMHRKYAFHIVLSGNRYSRAAQRKHAYRCYRQAYQVFRDRGWRLAEDHIQYTMAKQAYTLKKLSDASSSISHLLRPNSPQTAAQHAIFLKEYIQIQKQIVKNDFQSKILPIALPQVLHDSIRLLTASQSPIINQQYIPANNIDIQSDLSDEHIWSKLEEMIVTTAAGNKPIIFKPTQNLFTMQHASNAYPVSVQGESIEVAFTLLNPVRCPLKLENIDLLWELKLDNDEVLSNNSFTENDNEELNKAAVSVRINLEHENLHNSSELQKNYEKEDIQKHYSFIIDESSRKTLFFKCVPKMAGIFSIIGVILHVTITSDPSATLIGSLYFNADYINCTKKKAAVSIYSIKVIPQVPMLSVSLSPLPMDLVAGEILPVTISLHNLGIDGISNIYLGCDNPRWITILDKEADTPRSLLTIGQSRGNEKLAKEKELRSQHILRLLEKNNQVSLKTQESTNISLWIQAPYQTDEFTLRLLFYYECASSFGNNCKYRLVRHTWKFNIYEYLHSEITCVMSDTHTEQYGLNINVKNQSPNTVDLDINSVGLYCTQYRIKPNTLYLKNQINISSKRTGEQMVQPSSLNFQCRLEKAVEFDNMLKLDPSQQLNRRLSNLDISPAKYFKEGHLAPLGEMCSFLLKQEVMSFNVNIFPEDFSNAVEKSKLQATVVLNWTAIIQGVEQRIAVGQHFHKLYSMYEPGCLMNTRVKMISSDKKLSHSVFSKIGSEYMDHVVEDAWQCNNDIVGIRCYLEDGNTFTV